MTSTNGSHEEHATDLERAMIEQARLGDAYEHAIGTSAEQSAFARLQCAGRDVTQRDQVVREDRDERALRSSRRTPGISISWAPSSSCARPSESLASKGLRNASRAP